MNDLDVPSPTAPPLRYWFAVPLLLFLAACGGVDTAAPTPNVSKQNLSPQGGLVQALSAHEDAEVEDEDEDEDEDDVEAIVDGSFEAGVENPHWTATPGLLCTVAVCGDGAGTAGPEDGEVWAWFGGTSDPVTETLEQTIMLPRGDAELEFEFWAGAVSASTFSFQVTLDGREIFSYSSADLAQDDDASDEAGDEENDATLTSFSSNDEDENDKDYTEGYEDVEIDLSDYTDDKTHLLRFSFTKDGLGDTNLSLDDVSLEVEALEDATQDIADMVVALQLKVGLERALVSKLTSASKAFERNKDKVGVNNLRAFTHQVKAQSKGKRKNISAADATILIASAQEIIAVAQ